MTTPQPTVVALASSRSAVGSNLPRSTHGSSARTATAGASSSSAPIQVPRAIPRSAPVFNFPHAHRGVASQISHGVGDLSPLQPKQLAPARSAAAAAFNLPAPNNDSSASELAARGGQHA